MRVVIVYESMFGCTRTVATAIAAGFPSDAEVDVVGVAAATNELLDGADLIVVGGPTHAHGMSRPSTRRSAPSYVDKPGSDLVLEPGAGTGPGVREWLASLGPTDALAVAFDTRVNGPAVLTGRASKGIAAGLARNGLTLIARPESFLVSRQNHLMSGEEERARSWGAEIGSQAARRGARDNPDASVSWSS